MRNGWRVVLACALAMASGPGIAWAEVVDVAQSVGSSGSIGAVATLNVETRTISPDAVASGGVTFGAVTLGATPWVVAPRYLRVQHQSNNPNWAIRILTNNRALFPTMAGRVLDPKVLADLNDDILGYGGLIGASDKTNPNDRVPLAWQIYKDPQAGGPVAPSDAQVGDTSPGGVFTPGPWAFLADASDCPSTATNCRTAVPSTIDKTLDFLRIAQGDATSAFLTLHPNVAPRTSDGDVALYIAGRFGGAPADSYSTTIILELYHF